MIRFPGKKFADLQEHHQSRYRRRPWTQQFHWTDLRLALSPQINSPAFSRTKRSVAIAAAGGFPKQPTHYEKRVVQHYFSTAEFREGPKLEQRWREQ
jgi:hypothetical protein